MTKENLKSVLKDLGIENCLMIIEALDDNSINRTVSFSQKGSKRTTKKTLVGTQIKLDTPRGALKLALDEFGWTFTLY